MFRHHDFSRFDLEDDEMVTFYSVFDHGMEGVFTPRRFVYRDSLTGEAWSLPFAAMRQVRARCSGYAADTVGWDRSIDIWLDEPLDPEDVEERNSIGDLNIMPTDARQGFEVAARLSEAMIAARHG